VSARRAFLTAGLAGFGAMLVAFGIGRFGYPPLIPALIAQGWYSAQEASLAGAANLLGYGAGALAAPYAVRHLAPYRVMVIGLVLGIFAYGASAVPLPSVAFATLRAMSGFSGGFIMIAVPVTVMAQVAPHLRGRINGLSFTGIGSGFLFSGTVVPWLAAKDLSLAWLGITALLVLASIPALLFLPRTATPLAPAPQSAVESKRLSLPLIGLLIAYGASAIGYVPHTILFVDYVARGLGHGLATGGFLWGLAGIVAFCGPLLTGALADRTSFAFALRLILALMGFGALLPLFSQALPVLSLSIMLTGGLMPSCGALAAGRTREIVGGERQSGMWALVTFVFAAGQIVGGYGLSALMVLRPDPLLSFGLGGGLMLIGLSVDLGLAAFKKQNARA
jgi:MFS family permease